MFVKYVSTTTPTIAQIIADFAALASGTGIASLSASCDKTYSTAVTTVAPGWTTFDNAAPLSGYVITAPDADALTTKYVRIDALNSSTIELLLYETWNAGTHTGTNASNALGTLNFTASTINTYWLFVTPRTFMAWTISSSTNNTINSLMIAGEVAREIQYLKNTTYPCVFTGNTPTMMPTSDSSFGYMSRMKSMTATGDNTSSNARIWTASVAMKYQSSSSNITAPVNYNRAADESVYAEIRPMWLVNNSGGAPQVIGKVFDIMDISHAAGSTMDTISDGTNTYMILPTPTGGNHGICFKVA